MATVTKKRDIGTHTPRERERIICLAAQCAVF